MPRHVVGRTYEFAIDEQHFPQPWDKHSINRPASARTARSADKDRTQDLESPAANTLTSVAPAAPMCVCVYLCVHAEDFVNTAFTVTEVERLAQVPVMRNG